MKMQLVLLEGLRPPDEHYEKNQPQCYLSREMDQTGESRAYDKPACPLSLENAIQRHTKSELSEEHHTIF